MVFDIQLVPSAKHDLEDAFDHYYSVDPKLSLKFYAEFIALNELLRGNPFLQVKYKNIRTYSLKSFPFTVHFTVNRNPDTVIIFAIVFGKGSKNRFDERLLIL